jgi:O-acetyl-ADP-ribose deacetylase (regulator of RNase III)
MIKLVTGNLLDADADALVNPVNTVGVMGKGIALQFKEAFPHNYQVYRRACKDKLFDIGDILAVNDLNSYSQEKLIINFPTKKHWRQPSEYSYIESGLEALSAYINDNKVKSIAIPPLGCGNGGLDWRVVRQMIELHLSALDTDIQLYEPNIAVKELLQKQMPVSKVTLTPARAMLLYMLFHYEALGEYSSLFSANKLAFFLQKMGENLKLTFEAHLFGPYTEDVKRVLYSLNGTYLNGLEQNEAKAFEPLKLNYDRFDEIRTYINKELVAEQKTRLKKLIKFIQGFESDLSLEILASVAMILDNNPDFSLELVTEECKWNDRKKRLFKNEYIKIAYEHLHQTIYNKELSN